MSQYIVSARKYRPDSFESLIGQDNIARTLKNSILRGQLAHAYLFCGPRGVGKTSAARIFAKTINCSNPGEDMEPCGQCESCLSFQEGRSYCIHELDAASNNGVEDIKALMDQVQIPPQVGRYSVYIIDEVHMLSQAAFNAFLKTLEEPPAHAIFILATTEKHKIIPTILSRCQTYDFNRISIPDIVRNLRGIATSEGITVDEESLHVIARKADGAMRDALTIFDQTVAFCGTDIHYEDVIRNLNVLDYEYSFKMVDAFLSGDYATALMTFDEILSKGFNALHFISSIGSHLRDLLVSRTGGLESLLDMPDSLRARYQEQSARCSVKFVYDALGVISQCEAGYRASTNQRLHIEFALMRLSFLCVAPAADAVRTAPAPVAAPTPVHASTAALAPSAAPAVAPAAAPAPAPAVAPEPKPAPAPAAAPAPVAETAVAPTESPASAAAVSAVQSAPKPAPVPRRRPAKTGAGLSLSALMADEDEMMVVPVSEETEVAASKAPESLPDMEAVAEKWKELASSQSRQPRLANALANARLSIEPGDGYETVQFSVTNESQKRWIEERILRDLEGGLQNLLGCSKVRLAPVVIPDAEQEKKVYMPSEKARDLMEKNEEVKNLVRDLSLDIK